MLYKQHENFMLDPQYLRVTVSQHGRGIRYASFRIVCASFWQCLDKLISRIYEVLNINSPAQVRKSEVIPRRLIIFSTLKASVLKLGRFSPAARLCLIASLTACTALPWKAM